MVLIKVKEFLPPKNVFGLDVIPDGPGFPPKGSLGLGRPQCFLSDGRKVHKVAMQDPLGADVK
jgi:hypothetical protein